MSDQTVKVITVENSAQSLEAILSLEKRCFPREWQYANAEDYYREALENPEAIHLFFVVDGQQMGYLLATPFANAYADLAGDDPLLKEGSVQYYLDTIGIAPECQGKGGGRKLLEALGEEAKRRGVQTLAAHARTTNHLDTLIEKVFEGKVITKRPMVSWKYGGGEPYVYMEWSV